MLKLKCIKNVITIQVVSVFGLGSLIKKMQISKNLITFKICTIIEFIYRTKEF